MEESLIAGSLLTRREEKEELGELNDRLAVYIEYVRKLKGENASLVSKVSSYDENFSVYTVEIAKLRDANQALMNENAELRQALNRSQEENGSLQNQLGQERARVKKLEDEIQALKRDLEHSQSLYRSVSTEITEIRVRLETSETERKDLQRALKAAKALHDAAEKAKAEISAQLESLRADLKFKDQLIHSNQAKFDQEVTTLRVKLSNQNGDLKKAYAESLQQALQQARELFENEAQVYRREVRQFHERNVRATVPADQNDTILALRVEVDNLRAANSSLTTSLANANSKITYLEGRIVELERTIAEGKRRFALEMEAKLAEIASWKSKYYDLADQFQKLAEAKIALDAEIEHYRKLLDSEFNRLGVPAAGNNLKRKATEGAVSSPSKRMVMELDASTETTGPLHIDELNIDGLFARIANTTSESINLKGWSLRSVDNKTGQSAQFALPDLLIEGNGQVTVYTHSATDRDDSTLSISWDDLEHFFVGDQTELILSSKDSQSRTVIVAKAVEVTETSSSFSITSSRPGDLFRPPVDPSGGNRESCSLM